MKPDFDVKADPDGGARLVDSKWMRRQCWLLASRVEFPPLVPFGTDRLSCRPGRDAWTAFCRDGEFGLVCGAIITLTEGGPR